MSGEHLGIVLLAHGSRDAQWRAPIEAAARRIAERSPSMRVCCAYLELCSPDLSSAVQTLAQAGVDSLRVLPLFLGMGRHAREDLPRLIEVQRQAHPSMRIELLPTLGEDPAFVDWIATLALR